MPSLDEDRRRKLLTEARVGRLATVTGDGRPHLVPCCFVHVAADGVPVGAEDPPRGVIYSIVDGKPKSTTSLRRLDNVRANPAASLVIDRYAENWSELWWVRVDGRASILEHGQEYERARRLLIDKYEQYRADPPGGAVLRIDVTGSTGWSASP